MAGSSCGKIGLVHYSHPIYQMTSCPVTCGLPTRMLLESFAWMCNERQIRGTHCGDVCRGSLPPELTLVTIAEMKNELRFTNYELLTEQDRPENEQNKETDMATREQREGNCGVCGVGGKKIRDTKGVGCCSTCEHIMRAANNNPLVLLKAIVVATGKAELVRLVEDKYFGLKLVPVEQEGGQGEDRQELNAELAAANVRQVKQLRDLEDENNKLRGKIEELAVSHADLENENSTLFEKFAEAVKNHTTANQNIDELRDDIQRLTGELEGLQDVLTSQEEERTALLTEKNRLTEEVRWLYERLGAYEKTADGMELKIDQLQEKQSSPPVPEGYQELWLILREAMLQSATGKGLERHGEIGVPFISQPICTIARDVGLGFPLGQALKKVRESNRLSWLASRRELLGAIVYTAAAVIVGDEKRSVVDQEAA